MAISLKTRLRKNKSTKKVEMKERVFKTVKLIDRNEIDYKLCLKTFTDNLFKNDKFDKRTNEFKHTYSLSQYDKQDIKKEFNELFKKELKENIKFNFKQNNIFKDDLFLFKSFFYHLKTKDNNNLSKEVLDYLLNKIRLINVNNFNNYFDYKFIDMFYELSNRKIKCEIELNLEFVKKNDNCFYELNVSYLNFGE